MANKPTKGGLMRDMLIAGYSATAVLANIQAIFPGTKTTLKCVYFYSSQLRKEGKFGGLQSSVSVDTKALAALRKELKG